MAGRILGVLLISDPPEQSMNDLAEMLHASKSSISPNTRLLTRWGSLSACPPPESRQVAFRFAEGRVVFTRLRLMASLHEIAERGLELLQDEAPAFRERL